MYMVIGWAGKGGTWRGVCGTPNWSAIVVKIKTPADFTGSSKRKAGSNYSRNFPLKNLASSCCEQGSMRIRVLTAVLMKIQTFRGLTPCLLVRIFLSEQRNVSEDMSFRSGTCFGRTDCTDILYLTTNVWTYLLNQTKVSGPGTSVRDYTRQASNLTVN